ncbi:MAG: paraquat-inducible protein A [Nitrospirae bacterium]|jgi:paraquat-inducible protein A|nr:paraquat-inducible protein A [Nitrospirota bacterium]
MTSGVLTACHECDLLQREPILPPGGVACCRRCSAVLFRDIPDAVDRALAYTLGAAFLFIIANLFPIVGLEAAGIANATSLYGAVETIWKSDMEGVAALVFITTILIPAMEISLRLYVLLPLKLGHVPQGLAPILRLLQSVRPWSMTQVFILGVLVALVKLAHLAHIVPGIALWSFGGLILLLTGATVSFNTHELWSLVKEDE